MIVRLLKYCKIWSVKCIISVLGGLYIALIVDLLVSPMFNLIVTISKALEIDNDRFFFQF